ncbi:response regulator [Methylorubrum salsuginis]|uniref:histidine kinase n=1 Tax=Methylorubrum salsuginis TaxID=414703 RepID=A0A1I4DK48_9HYPH|nr:response regulator [Methylorubrum salsuginis]SFK92251.1 PAS domain S-box-containing protein [Methylorubrum salsuginis]
MTGGVRSRPLVVSFALFALALMVPPATVAVVATRWYVISEQERLSHTLALIAEEIRSRIDHDLAQMETVARTLAASPSIDAGDLAAFRIQALASFDPAEATVTLADLDGRQRVNTRASDDSALPTLPRPDLIARLVATRRPVISGLMSSPLTGRPIVSVFAPVIRDGAVVRLVALVALADRFEALIRSPHVTDPYWASVIDGNGEVVARIGQADAVDEPTSASQSGAEDGILRIEETSRLSDWRFATGVGRDALEAPLRRSLLLLLTFALALIGLGGWFALRTARRIARAAARLAAEAEGIGRGEVVAAQDSVIREVRVVEHALASASRTLHDQRAALDAAQAALAARAEASQSRFRMLADNVGDIIVLFGAGAWTFGEVSPSFERMLGYDAAARAGLTLTGFVHPEDRRIVEDMRAALSTGQSPATGLFRARHRDGAWLWLECVSSRIEGADPSEPQVIAVMRDVTARKQQADELRLACDMAELAKAKAENASRAKSEFLAMMSHEIRTPLATIRGYAELLGSSGPLSAEQARSLARVSEATGTMLTAVDDILDVARIEAGDFQLREEDFSLAEAVESVTAFVRPAAAEKGVTLGLSIEPELPRAVRGDPRRLRQILLNLLNVNLRERRGGLVTLSLYALRGAENRISFALTGSGGHAPPAERNGLGLAIAGRLIARMGGRLETVSFAGEASSHRFSLHLPAAETAFAPAAPQTAPAEPDATAAADAEPPTAGGLLAGAKILLVEDHTINQALIRRLLERQGCRVAVVEDGAAAIEAVQAHIPDLVLMDVQMPGMDGLTATRRIRALPHPCRHVPILGLTANVLPEQVYAIREAGMNGHIAKPVDRDRLCAAIAEHLPAVMLAEVPATTTPASMPVIDRAAYDRLVGSLGTESARGALRGFVALLDVTFSDAAILRAEAPTIASGARRFGLTDLAAALDGLEQDGDAALRRCHVARDLVGRAMDELVGVAPVEVSALIAHL